MAPVDVTYATAPRIATDLARARYFNVWLDLTLEEQNSAVARVLEHTIWPHLQGAKCKTTTPPSPAPYAGNYRGVPDGSRAVARRFSPAPSVGPSPS